MKINLLFGTILGLAVGGILSSVFFGKFDFGLLVALLIGGLVGHFSVAYFSNKKSEDQ
ncbi:hypothetical protein [Pseudalkalibacillus caeni]|uniref:hypothetical protein n=1 Tax=Exobacillus caeni TaxID=2574798 RepID=UPI00148592EA|nr:hypothetical protein [Pseudalkalibacillus caeni]